MGDRGRGPTKAALDLACAAALPNAPRCDGARRKPVRSQCGAIHGLRLRLYGPEGYRTSLATILFRTLSADELVQNADPHSDEQSYQTELAQIVPAGGETQNGAGGRPSFHVSHICR
jgi:hypothetical protein